MLDAVFLAVVIRELLAFLDVLDRHNEDAAFVDLCLAVRAAGMVDVPGLIDLRLAVDGALFRYLKQVLALARFRFLLGKLAPDILDNAGALGDRLSGKEPEAGA